MTALRITAHVLWIMLIAVVGLVVLIAALALRAYAPVAGPTRISGRRW